MQISFMLISKAIQYPKDKTVGELLTMAGFGNLVQKAFYLGVGAASVAAEKAGSTIQDLREQAQGIADEMVQKGEMTTDEARKFVNEMVHQAQQRPIREDKSSEAKDAKEPRRIEILDEDEEETSSEAQDQAAKLRQEVEKLQEELRNLKQ